MGQASLIDEDGRRNVVSNDPRPVRRPMDDPSLPIMRDFRRFVDPLGLPHVRHSANKDYGDGTAARSINEPVDRTVKNGGCDHYCRMNLRLNDDQNNRAIRRASGELWLMLLRRQSQDTLGPFVAFTEEECAFARLPYRYRALSETADPSRVKILAMGELRAIRHRLGNPRDRSFFTRM